MRTELCGQRLSESQNKGADVCIHWDKNGVRAALKKELRRCRVVESRFLKGFDINRHIEFSCRGCSNRRLSM